MMTITKKMREKFITLQTVRLKMKRKAPFCLCLMIGILMFSAASRGDISGHIQSVDGKTVRIVLEGSEVPEIGAKVKISDEVSGVGLVPLMGTWKVTALEGDVVVAVTEDVDSGTPLPGYLVTISGASRGTAKPPPDVKPPQEKMKPLPKVKREPPEAGVGTGTIAKAKTTWPYIVLPALAVGIIILTLSITAIRKAESGQRAKIKAAFDIAYSDGGRKTFVIKEERTTIGRRKDNDLVLNDSGVSSHHAEIIATSKGFLLYDSGSANGTFLNEKKISNSKIFAGDKIKMGSTVLYFKS